MRIITVLGKRASLLFSVGISGVVYSLNSVDAFWK